MSINLHLFAERTVYTKSGRQVKENKEIDILQTPTELSRSLIVKENFELILDGYCDWVESFYKPDEIEIVVSEIDFLPIDEYSIIKTEEFSYNDHTYYKYSLKEILPSTRLRRQIEKLKKDEYELSLEAW
jgi:hypothetical protein